METQKTFWHISKLKNWDKNPKAIRPEDYERLKNQIRKLGQYKPLIITPDGIVLGGNMRLRAYRDLGIEEVWVSIVHPKNESEMLEYALSDNDRAGYYEEKRLAELLSALPEFPLDDYRVDLAYQSDLQSILERFNQPNIERDIDTLHTEQLSKWLQSDIREIVLIFSAEEFERTIKRLEAVIEKEGLKNNTEAVLKLLDFYENHNR
jgi:hypothetical protein